MEVQPFEVVDPPPAEPTRGRPPPDATEEHFNKITSPRPVALNASEFEPREFHEFEVGDAWTSGDPLPLVQNVGTDGLTASTSCKMACLNVLPFFTKQLQSESMICSVAGQVMWPGANVGLTHEESDAVLLTWVLYSGSLQDARKI